MEKKSHSRLKIKSEPQKLWFSGKVLSGLSDRINMKHLLLSFLFLPFGFLSAQSSLNAFGDSPWGSSYKDVKEKFASLLKNPSSTEDIKILNEVKNKLLVVKRNNVTYYYRFYKQPKEVADFKANEKNADGSKPDHKAMTGLFSVGLFFSPVESSMVKESLKKYGSPTREYLVENKFGIMKEAKAAPVAKKAEEDPAQDKDDADENTEAERKIPMALIWNLSAENNGAKEGGFIFQWNEPYNKKLYTKRLDYFSAEVTALINDDYKKYFSASEAKIIQDLMNESGENSKGSTSPSTP